MTKFPLIEEDLGLEVHRCQETMHPGTDGTRYMIDAEALERLLSQAPVVHGDGYGWEDPNDRQIGDNGERDTHTARLIGVKKIKKDSAEDFIRDWLVRAEAYGGNPEFLKRAKKLLEGKE